MHLDVTALLPYYLIQVPSQNQLVIGGYICNENHMIQYSLMKKKSEIGKGILIKKHTVLNECNRKW